MNAQDAIYRPDTILTEKILTEEAYYRYIENTQAKEEGRAEGRAEQKLDNARNLKQMNVPLDTIAKALNLTKKRDRKTLKQNLTLFLPEQTDCKVVNSLTARKKQ